MKTVFIAVVCCALFILAGAQVKTSHESEVYSRPGRYQIIINPNARADTFLLDTENGRIWKPLGISDIPGQPVVWKFQDRVDNQAEFNMWLAKFPAPAAK